MTVRVILDQNNEKANNTTAYNTLTAGKVSVHWANPAYACTHQKTITVDQATSAIMTLNLTPEDYTTTRDFAVITNNAADVAAIEATFNADFTNAAITPPTGQNLVWSPTNSRSALLALIDGATKSLLISQEEFADTGIQSALEAALKRGVAVTLVQENLSGTYSSVLNTLKAAGAQNSHFQLQNRLLHPRQNRPRRLRHGAGQAVCGFGKLLHRFAQQTTANWVSSSPMQPAWQALKPPSPPTSTKGRNSESHTAPQLGNACTGTGVLCGGNRLG